MRDIATYHKELELSDLLLVVRHSDSIHRSLLLQGYKGADLGRLT